MKSLVVTEEFKSIVDKDINRCKYEICYGNKTSRDKLFYALISKYKNIIDGFDFGLNNLFYDTEGESVEENISMLSEKLELFKSMGYQNFNKKEVEEKTSPISVNNYNNNQNDNSNQNYFSLSFTNIRNKIENMSSLPDAEIEEILSKIGELETILESTERKSKKWEKGKDILKWFADKGVDVAISVLPLFLNFQ